ncbi:MAG: hypothetical protein ACRDYY_08770 [Acidimicrobiales bacterium]
MCSERLEISKISREDENAIAAGFVISNGNHDRVDGRGCSSAGRYDFVA